VGQWKCKEYLLNRLNDIEKRFIRRPRCRSRIDHNQWRERGTSLFLAFAVSIRDLSSCLLRCSQVCVYGCMSVRQTES
jgi:hypothetical protein